jgi:hypothetical protein
VFFPSSSSSSSYYYYYYSLSLLFSFEQRMSFTRTTIVGEKNTTHKKKDDFSQ